MIQRINLTLTRDAAASLLEALMLFGEVGTGEGADSSLLSDADMQTVACVRQRLAKLLQQSRKEKP